jgi:hypothetical protein
MGAEVPSGARSHVTRKVGAILGSFHGLLKCEESFLTRSLHELRKRSYSMCKMLIPTIGPFTLFLVRFVGPVFYQSIRWATRAAWAAFLSCFLLSQANGIDHQDGWTPCQHFNVLYLVAQGLEWITTQSLLQYDPPASSLDSWYGRFIPECIWRIPIW